MLLTRDQFLVAPAPKFVDVPCPEFSDVPGATIRIKLMSGLERDAFETSLADRQAIGKLRENMRAMVVIYSVVDEAGAFMFTEADLDKVGSLPWTLLDRIQEASQALNKTAAKSVEELEKNSEPSRTADSPSN